MEGGTGLRLRGRGPVCRAAVAVIQGQRLGPRRSAEHGQRDPAVRRPEAVVRKTRPRHSNFWTVALVATCDTRRQQVCGNHPRPAGPVRPPSHGLSRVLAPEAGLLSARRWRSDASCWTERHARKPQERFTGQIRRRPARADLRPVLRLARRAAARRVRRIFDDVGRVGTSKSALRGRAARPEAPPARGDLPRFQRRFGQSASQEGVQGFGVDLCRLGYDLGVPSCRGAFTPSTRVVSIRRHSDRFQ